jgi:uncharacterized metal-binding protein YceD (DUF177 family)
VTPEFHRPERADAIGDRPREVAVAADAAERAALARRFGLVAVEALTATFVLRREAGGIVADGRVAAAVTQACSVTGDPIAARVDEPVALLFTEAAAAEAGEEVELSADALDALPIEGGMLDLGEAAAETMALALDPFPRGPGAAAALRDAGVLSEEEAGPFSGLAGLKAALEAKGRGAGG